MSTLGRIFGEAIRAGAPVLHVPCVETPADLAQSIKLAIEANLGKGWGTAAKGIYA